MMSPFPELLFLAVVIIDIYVRISEDVRLQKCDKDHIQPKR